jgi:uncharacterized membrane protein
MQIINPLQINKWNIKKFLIVILSIQLAVWGLIGLDAINIHIPLLRQLICFIYLTFVPGLLILRILRLHKLGNIETILYSVGLSIASIMFIGFLMNFLYPIFGIDDPISLLPIIITISFFVIILSFLSCRINQGVYNQISIDTNDLISPTTLFLCSIPLLAIFGTYVLNYYDNNLLQMILLLIIALFPLISLKWIPKKFYPFLIFITSISLLLHTTLISPYIWGADINTEYYLSSLILKNSIWNIAIGSDVNAMLSIVILAPIFSILSNINLIWCFKIVYPFFFSLIPLGLFLLYKKMTTNEIAILACLFFVFVNAYFTTLVSAARQEIAEMFLVLIIMLFMSDKIKGNSRSLLLVIFGLSLVVSHYGLAYIFIIIIIIAYLFKFIISKIERSNFNEFNLLNNIYPILLLVFALAWFMYISGSSIFINGVMIGHGIINSITDILNPSTSQGLSIITGQFSYLQSIERYLYLICDGFITLGLLGLYKNKWKFNEEYKYLSLGSFSVLILGIILPIFSGSLNTDRLFHINSIFLSIFLVIGFLNIIVLLNTLFKRFSLSFLKLNLKKSLYVLAIFLMIFFLFNAAFLYQVFDQNKVGRFALDNNVDFLDVNNQELQSINWISNVYDPNIKIYADVNKAAILSGKTNNSREIIDPKVDLNSQLDSSYIFLGKLNINNNEIYVHGSKPRELYYIPFPNFENFNQIYNNGESWILKG